MNNNPEYTRLKEKCAFVVGCGGLGCYIIEFLARINIGKIIVADDDKFSSSNLNRQLYSTKNVLGEYKTDIAKEKVFAINEKIEVVALKEKVTKENIKEFSYSSDIIFDACDNIETKLVIEKFCEKENKVFIHGAINGTIGQVATVFPKDKTLSKIYHNKKDEKNFTYSFVPGLIASIQVSEAIKVLSNEENTLRGKLLLIDLLSNTFETLDFLQ